MRAPLFLLALVLSGCVYVSHPVIYYHHRETEAVMKAYLAGEKLAFDQPALRPFYVNGVLLTPFLAYSGTEGRPPEDTHRYSLGFSARSYSAGAKIELKKMEILGATGLSLPASGAVELTLPKVEKWSLFLQKHRDAGLHLALLSVTNAITEAGLKAAAVQNKRVTLVALVVVTNNGRAEEREITYVFGASSSGHLSLMD